jgi:hypothetical protein
MSPIILYDQAGQPVGVFHPETATLLEQYEPMPGWSPPAWERLYSVAPGPQYLAVDEEVVMDGRGDYVRRKRARRLTTLEAIAWYLERGRELPEGLRRVADQPEPDLADLDALQWKILELLAARPRTALTQYELAAGVDMGRRTVGGRLEGLRDRGLVERPHGERGGEQITSAGQAVLKRRAGPAAR